jgi:hypothetical protein
MAFSKRRIIVGVVAVAALVGSGVIIAKKMKGFRSEESLPPAIDVTGVGAERLQAMTTEMRDLVAVTEECALGERIDLELSTGQAAALQIEGNSLGLREILIGTQGGTLRELFVWRDGEVTGGVRGLTDGWSARGISGEGFWVAVWDEDEKAGQVTLMGVVDSDQEIWDSYVAIQQRRLRGEALKQAIREMLENL